MSGLHDGDTSQDRLSPDLVIGEDGRARPPWAASDPLLMEYYDTEWGVPVKTESGVFERLSLEAFQSGLSWSTILRKRVAFREAFANFDPNIVATFDEDAVASLMANPAIIRNERKIRATIRKFLSLRRGLVLCFHVTAQAFSVIRHPFAYAGINSTSEDVEKEGFFFRRSDHHVCTYGSIGNRRYPPRRCF